MKNNYKSISSLLEEVALGSDKVAKYFKTTAGSYGEHDRFIGMPVPILRQLAKQIHALPILELRLLLSSKINEERLLALIILVSQYQKADSMEQERIYQFYLENLSSVNNWNLVDLSARDIIGKHLINRDKELLVKLAHSKILWERRIAIVSTWQFIIEHQFDWTIKISTLLLKDKEDLIHKAVGWMLREIGKRNLLILKEFLKSNNKKMPRTMLRYVIERLSDHGYLMSNIRID